MSSPRADLVRPADLSEAIALLTRMPVAGRFGRGGAAAWAWPLAGIVVALVAAIAGGLGQWLGLPAPLAAGVVLTTQILVTGALHEDGLADTADGLWGGHDRPARLEIMKDSRIGSYGVLALGLSLLLRWSALSTIIASGWLLAPLLAAAMLSRAPMAVIAAAMPNARGHGLSASVGRPPAPAATLAAALAATGALLCLGTAALAPILWVSLSAIAVAAVARTKIGGQTGDILGAVQITGETAALAALAAVLG